MNRTLQEILAHLETLKPGEAVAILTLMEKAGSTYRQPGARMMVTPEGKVVGTLSGGCLRQELVEQALELLASERPAVYRTYRTLPVEEDVLWGYGMGCEGMYGVLLERCRREDLLHRVLRRVHGGLPARMITCCAEPHVGMRRIHWPGGEVWGTWEGRGVEEWLEPPFVLRIFGAGVDALPLVDLASRMGWRVELYDFRPELLEAVDAVGVHRRVCVDDALDLPEVHAWGAVVMSHHFAFDRRVLEALEGASPVYIGLLGPARRRERLMEGLNLEAGRVYGPVGLDIGAEAPEEIALAIVAEIQAVLRGRSGGMLRDKRRTSIHAV